MNSVNLIGRLVADPETQFTKSTNTQVTRFRIAINRANKGRDGQTSADFIDIEAWKQTAEFVSKHFTKGQQVGITGRIRVDTWTDQQGQKRSRTMVVADTVHFASERKQEHQMTPDTTTEEKRHTEAHSEQQPYQLGEDDDLPF